MAEERYASPLKGREDTCRLSRNKGQSSGERREGRREWAPSVGKLESASEILVTQIVKDT